MSSFDIVYTWAARNDPQWRARRRDEWERYVASLPPGAANPQKPRTAAWLVHPEL